MSTLSLLDAPTRLLFFTGKGGVGKTSLAAAVALALVDAGKKVLLVSTDAASNLDEVLAVSLANTPRPVPGISGFWVVNIDPIHAAEDYRKRVLNQLSPSADSALRALVREQLGGACTTEIAAFAEFVALLSTPVGIYDHVIFDTAPTGHSLRLLSLPRAWTKFLRDNERGASCLGPHSGLKLQEASFRAALALLTDPKQTTIVLVTRPETSAMAETARAAEELNLLGLSQQRLIVNGVFKAADAQDQVALSIQQLGEQVIAQMPPLLRRLACDSVPLQAFDTLGVMALRALLGTKTGPSLDRAQKPLAIESAIAGLPQLDALADQLAQLSHGLILVMGKGGVGKTTIAAALALGLVARGKRVQLSTTDPAAHLAATLNGEQAGLKLSRIDPRIATQGYIQKIMATEGAHLDADAKALLLEDLQSPCTEEVAVFHAFAKLVSEAKQEFVVLDTAPTGHSLLLMDATGAYHRQSLKDMQPTGIASAHMITPLMRLQNPDYSHIILVTLPETTPVSQAAALQEDLRRAGVEPYAWVINKTLLLSGTQDPLLRARMPGELAQIARIQQGMAQRLFILPWQAQLPLGIGNLQSLVTKKP